MNSDSEENQNSSTNCVESVLYRYFKESHVIVTAFASLIQIISFSGIEYQFGHINANSSLMDIVNNIIAPLFVAVISWMAGLWYSKMQERRKFRERIEAAPLVFVRELDLLIQKALNQGVQDAIVNGRAIVAARNTLRSTLSAISKQLNSEIDRLAIELGLADSEFKKLDETFHSNTKPNAQKAFQTIEVLAKIWPAKRKQIEVEVRKLLAELGLDSKGE